MFLHSFCYLLFSLIGFNTNGKMKSNNNTWVLRARLGWMQSSVRWRPTVLSEIVSLVAMRSEHVPVDGSIVLRCAPLAVSHLAKTVPRWTGGLSHFGIAQRLSMNRGELNSSFGPVESNSDRGRKVHRFLRDRQAFVWSDAV